MKRYLPVLLFILFFSGFLTFQVGKEYFGVEATFLSTTDGKKLHLESTFSHSTFQDFSNRTISITSDLVLITFWATWCAPCRLELQGLNKLVLQYPTLQIIAVNLDDASNKESAVAFITELNPRFDIASGSDELADNFNVSQIPYSILFKSGKAINEYNGTHESIVDDINRTLAQ